jgi:thiamine-phosphate pyrophosphorylase
MYKKLQYISQGNTIEAQLYNIQKVLDSGCDWIQLRFKTRNTTDLVTLAKAVKEICSSYKATLIINDNVYLAQQIAANGVHLGLTDMGIPEARRILGADKIIGATANTFEDILTHVQNTANYIGLGPFQFTTTKQKLSPILGLEGYRSTLQKLRQKQVKIPIYAIGGITSENVEPLMDTGIHGIAVSGLLTHSDNPTELIKHLNEKLYVTI